MVLITGGSGGVGAQLARNFAKLNSRVVIWDINKEGKFINFNQIDDDETVPGSLLGFCVPKKVRLPFTLPATLDCMLVAYNKL